MRRKEKKEIKHALHVTSWKTDLIGAMVEYSPLFSIRNDGLKPGMQGIITDGEWVSNYSVGTSFCAYNVLWMDLGNSRSFRSIAHFTTKDLKIIALA